jgi:protein TonB
MVRAHALSRPAGFALLKPAAKPQLDSIRILTLSSTLAFNLLAFGLLMMPMALPPPAVQDTPSHNPIARPIARQPQVVEFVPIAPSLPHPSAPTLQHQRVAPAQNDDPPATALAETGSQAATEPASLGDELPLDISGDSGNPAPTPAHLAYRVAPAPAYPRAALQRHLSGTVLLRVLVGTDGHPLEVTVASSSGHRELDEAARTQVLKRWSFQPATREGQTVQAIGMVPVEFKLPL